MLQIITTLLLYVAIQLKLFQLDISLPWIEETETEKHKTEYNRTYSQNLNFHFHSTIDKHAVAGIRIIALLGKFFEMSLR